METTKLKFDKTIENWDEGIALGNGDMGCLIWNRPECLRFSIDKGGLWDCSDPPENQENFTYADLKNLVKNKKQREITKKYDRCYDKPTPTKLPAGKIIIDTGENGNIESELDLLTAEAVLKTGNIKINSFIHALDTFGLIKINSGNITYKVENPAFGLKKKNSKNTAHRGITQGLKNLHYEKAESIEEEKDGISFQYFIQKITDGYYGIVSGMKKSGNESLIAYTAAYGKTADFAGKALETIKKALSEGYEKAFSEHKKFWDEYSRKSSINIPDKELEKQWYLNTYLLGAGSRKNHFPMPLQGLWTADNGSLPPWKGDYHHDLNTQMTYTSYLAANRPEQGECFIDYLLSMTKAGESFAESFYGVKGLCLPSVMDIEGHALGGWAQYALSPVNQLWLCQIMSRYYYFTRNREYLDKIYEYNEKTGTFLMNILEEKDGKYKLPLSSSPEINDNSLSAWLTPNSNYDLCLMEAFMRDMINLSREKGEEEKAELWEKRLSKLEKPAVDGRHVLMLSPDMILTESHRHHAHCMAIYPLKTIEYDTDENRLIIDSTVKDLENLGISNWVGYSVGWMAEFYAAMGRGDDAAGLLHTFFRYNCTANGFHINGDPQEKLDFSMKYRVFTLEGNFLACDALQSMLIYSEKNKIKIFPAVPSDWKDARFRDFRAWGNLLISADMTDGKISYIKIYAGSEGSFEILNSLENLTPDKKLADKNKITLKTGETIIFS